MNEFLKIYTIEEEGLKINECLGINQERRDELRDIISEAVESTETYTAAFAALSEKVANANELAWCCFHIGTFAEKQRGIGAALSKIFG